MEYVLGAVIIVLAVAWVLSLKQRLMGMNENLQSALNRIVLQTSSLYDALTALLEQIREIDAQEVQTLIEQIRSKRRRVGAESALQQVYEQQLLASDAIKKISVLAAQHPAIADNPNYLSCRAAVEQCTNRVRTSWLLYNDSVTRFNREIRLFPASLLAKIMGLRQKEHLEETV